MKKITLTSSCAGVDFSYNIGDIVSEGDPGFEDEGSLKRYVDAGYAKWKRKSKKEIEAEVEAEVETASESDFDIETRA